MSQPVCDTCKAPTTWLVEMPCPLLADDDMGESDGSVCWLCHGEGEIHVCGYCFYLGPDAAIEARKSVEASS